MAVILVYKVDGNVYNKTIKSNGMLTEYELQLALMKIEKDSILPRHSVKLINVIHLREDCKPRRRRNESTGMKAARETSALNEIAELLKGDWNLVILQEIQDIISGTGR